jgi:hypothetical protein
MNIYRQIIFCACLFLGASLGFAQAAGPALPVPSVNTSPVDLFRRLLTTNEAARAQFLASRTPQARKVIEAKLREYAALSAEEQNSRLYSLQLRWYTQQLLRMKAADRMQQITKIAEPDRTIVAGRLGRFSILPPPLQQAVLTNQLAINVFAAEGSVRLSIDPRRDGQFERLTQFIEMEQGEQQKVMVRLTETEHAQMQKTLSTFGKLPAEERREALEGFRKFASLSDNDRTAFLSTANRWRGMSEADRQFWRNIVAALQRSSTTLPIPPVPVKPLAGISQSSD